MASRDEQRFELLIEQAQSGPALSAAEQAELNALLAAHPHLATEAAMLRELGNLEAHPNAASRALADAALAALQPRHGLGPSTAGENTASHKTQQHSRAADPMSKFRTQPGSKARSKARSKERGHEALMPFGLHLPKRSAERKPGPGHRGLPQQDAGTQGRQLEDPLALDFRGSSGHKRNLGRTLGALVASVAMVAGTLWTLTPDPAPESVDDSARAELVMTSGEVTLRTAEGAAARSLDSGYSTLLQQGEVIEVREGRACFILDPGVNVCIGKHSQLRMEQLADRKRRFELQRGRVALSLDKQPRGFEVTVIAGDVESTAVGTVFSVARSGSRVRTNVLEGTVKVQPPQRPAALVNAHQQLVVTHHGESRQHTLTRRQESSEWALVEATRLWKGRAAATLNIQGQPARAEVWLDGWLAGRAPLTTLIPAGRRRVVVRDGSRKLLDTIVTLRAGERSSLQFVGPEPPRTGEGLPPKAETTEAPSPAALLREAHGHLRQRRFSQAVRTYNELRQRYPKTAEARAALVAVAQLQLEQGKSPRAALNQLERYLAAGPGPLTEEARYLRIRALGQLGLHKREGKAIRAFLDTHPQNFHGEALRTRLRELQVLQERPSP